MKTSHKKLSQIIKIDAMHPCEINYGTEQHEMKLNEMKTYWVQQYSATCQMASHKIKNKNIL